MISNGCWAVNVESGIALDAEGRALVIASMFDADGDETEDPEAAVAVVAQHPNGSWWAIDLRAFERVEVH